MKMIFIVSLLLPFFVQAGHVVGNGGNGVKIGQDVYLLDLLEAGVEKAPYWNESVTDQFSKYLKSDFSYSDRLPMDLLSRKISEIALKDEVFAHSVVDVFQRLTWTFVHYRLKTTTDAKPIGQFDGEIVQLALRRNETVFIDEMYWKQLSQEHQAALVLHEVLYAYITPYLVNDNGAKLEQSSLEVRKLIGLFFSMEFQRLPAQYFSERLGYRFPNKNLFRSNMPGAEQFLITRKNGATLFRPVIKFRDTYLDIYSDFNLRNFKETVCILAQNEKAAHFSGELYGHLVDIENIARTEISYFKWNIVERALAPIAIDSDALCSGKSKYGIDEKIIEDIFTSAAP